MVVLEGHNMLGVNSPNQYLQPDYLSPLPTTLDAKKSPLALLVQTCSQIGADTPSSKSLLHPSPLSSSDSTSSISSGNSGAGQKRKASTSSDSGHGGSLKSLGIASDSSSNDSRPRSSGSTSSTGSSAKQPRLSHSTSPGHHQHHQQHHQHHHGKVSPKQSNNNNGEGNSVIIHSNNSSHQHVSKNRKLSGQSMSSESSEKNRHAQHRSSPPGAPSNSASVIVPQGKHSSGSSASAGSRSPPNHTTTSHHEKSSSKSSSNEHSSSSSSKANSSPKPSSHQQDQGQSPIIRSGLDVLQGKDLPKFGAFGFPPGFDPTNPAFRLPFLASAAHHAHLLGYPPGGPGAPMPPTGSPYGLSYNRVKSASGVESIVPVCKDPYCTGCQYGGGMGHGPSNGSMGGICPAGCAQCDHQKFPMIPPSAQGPYASIPGFPPGFSHAALSAIASGYHPSILSHSQNANAAAMAAMLQHHHQAAAVAQQQQQQNAQRPHICSWIVGDSYCGKRFASSEELLQHLRTHTSSSVPTSSSSGSTEPASVTSASMGGHPGLPPPPVGASSMYSNALLNQSVMAAAAMQRAYPTPPLSPHSAARYNPAALYAAIAASGKPPGSTGPFAPPPPAALAGYYPSPYSMYGPRIG